MGQTLYASTTDNEKAASPIDIGKLTEKNIGDAVYWISGNRKFTGVIESFDSRAIWITDSVTGQTLMIKADRVRSITK